MYMLALCVPSIPLLDGVTTNVSLTNSYLSCNIGEGIKVRMSEPNSSDPNKYHYIGTLTVTENKEHKQEVLLGGAICLHPSSI